MVLAEFFVYPRIFFAESVIDICARLTHIFKNIVGYMFGSDFKLTADVIFAKLFKKFIVFVI